MKRLDIKALSCQIYIYNKEEKGVFCKAYDTTVGKAYGMTNGNGVWIGEHKDLIGLCYHEAVHLADWVIETRLEMTQGALESNTELRAYLTEYIGSEIRKYITGE